LVDHTIKIDSKFFCEHQQSSASVNKTLRFDLLYHTFYALAAGHKPHSRSTANFDCVSKQWNFIALQLSRLLLPNLPAFRQNVPSTSGKEPTTVPIIDQHVIA
jgi:hypothetical protein